MKLRNFSPVVISLLVGAALGYCLGPASSPAPAPEPEQKAEIEQDKQPDRRDHGDRAANRALRARIKELEDMLAKQGVEVEKMKDEETARRERHDGPRDFRADMERIRKEEPERYAQMTNGMAQFRQRRFERAQSKMDFLSSVDDSRMSPEARETHNKLKELIAQRAELESKISPEAIADSTEEERREFFEAMRDTDRQIRELNQIERDNLLQEAAKSLGLEGDDAKEVADMVKGIYDATESDRGFGPGGPGGRGPGGRGWRGGRGGNR